ncbi:putative two-component response regulator-like APRR6 isoform X2 [Momordica charantia]|uniref:Two-component response regulator-like APRR6 isoform X2 n=1 Tax=Momordica charantia TaxID=3673 RepID=A0A6J1DFR8_MOMCH|nr:putative two-component response regulator-like APRR6 isoform X2 [Momordica charantia]
MGYWVTDYLPRLDKNLNILVVDHDPLSLMQMASLLEQQFYKVTTTQQASVALSMIEEKGDRFDLVMANASMPDMDKFSFLHALLKKNIAVIFMLSGMNLDVATKPSAGGKSYFLQNPISKDDLKYVWQHIYHRNINVTKLAQKVNFIEKSKSGGIKIADTIDLSGSDANNNSYINYQPTNYKGKERTKQTEYQDGLVGSNFGGRRSSHDIEGTIKEKRIKFGSQRIDKDHERRNEYYIPSDGRSCLLWNAERHRKFTYALNKLGDRSRPKLILKMMNEPCLTLRQVANHLQVFFYQKHKAQVECIKRRRENKLAFKGETSKSNSSARTQLSPLLQKQHHKMRRIRDGSARSTCFLGGDKLRPIVPKTQPIPGLPVSNFANCGLGMLNHNFQQVDSYLNYNSIPFNNNKEVGLYPYNIQTFEKEAGNVLCSDVSEKFALVGEEVQISELNFPNVSTMASEVACSRIFDEIQLPDNLLDVVDHQLYLSASEIENQKAMECSGISKEIPSPFREITVPDSNNVAPDFIDWEPELPTTFGNEGSQPLTEYADMILNVLEDDPYNLGSDLSLSDVDKYCEWLRSTVLEDGSSPNNFICDNAEKVPIGNAQ